MDFQERIPVLYPIIFCDGATVHSLKVNHFPTLYIVEDGKIYYIHIGFSPEMDLYEVLDKKLEAVLAK